MSKITIFRTADVDENLNPIGQYAGEATTVCVNCELPFSRKWVVTCYDRYRSIDIAEVTREFKELEEDARKNLLRALRKHDCGPRI